MAIINTLRDKGGKILVILIVLALAAFILGDPSTIGLFGGQDRGIAEIDGSEITYEDFQARVNDLSYVFTINTNRNPQGDEVESIRNQAWQSLLVEKAYLPQYAAIGMNISNAEIIDMVQGDNTHPHVIQMMGNPQTGEFDRASITGFLQQISQAPPQQQEAWARFENTLAPSRMMMMMDNLLDKSNYITKAEARSEHVAQNSSVTVEYVYVPYISVSDSSIAVSNSELKDYLDDHSKEYDREESRDIAYVSFAIKPSAEDTALVVSEVDELYAGLRMAQNDSSYAAINTDGGFPFMTYRKESLPEILFQNGQPIDADSMAGPLMLDDRMVIYKMTSKVAGPEYVVKASHILLRPEDDSEEAKKASKATAEEVLRKVRAGGDFASLASEYSQDPSNAERGGDLGYFGEFGNFAQPFKDAAFGHKGTGLIPRVVETDFGFHIIRIDEAKDNTQYKVAIIEKEFFISNESLEEAYREAGQFKASVSNTAEFEKQAEEGGFKVEKQTRVTNQTQRVGTITSARSMILWLYNDAETDEVSDVFELDNNYVVAVMTGMQEKGIVRLADVENEITRKVKDQKIGKTVVEKLNKLGNKTFEEIVSGYGDGAVTQEATFTLSSNSISGIGLAPEAVGLAFSLKEGETTKAFESMNGVLIMKMVSKNAAQATEDYSTYIQQLANRRQSRKVVVTDFPYTYYRVMISQDLDNAIKELSGVEDKRYKFF
jgi:peptidyl-prolyl cis-trans isomerase D